MILENTPPKDKHEAPKEPTFLDRLYDEVHHVRDELQHKGGQVYKYAEHEVDELTKEKRDFFGIPETKHDKDGKVIRNPAAWNPFLM